MNPQMKQFIDEANKIGWTVDETVPNHYRFMMLSKKMRLFLISIEGSTLDELNENLMNFCETCHSSEVAYNWVDHFGRQTSRGYCDIREVIEDLEYCLGKTDSLRDILIQTITGRKY